MNTLRNRKHKIKEYGEGATSTEMDAIQHDINKYGDEIIYAKSLLSIQINGTHTCTGTPVSLEYGFTTANCAIKVKMNLPDSQGEKVRVYYGETLEFNSPWTTVDGISLVRENATMATLDESYRKRVYDYGFIRVSFSLNY